ncbi:MAG: metallophosphoesterase family protein [Clostridia bacterium]|nr:metallophosphoesterase family protein [Clostridia bacterium]
MRLPDQYTSRIPLRFRPDGGFRILMMSDLHYALDRDERTIKAMELLLDSQKPDFVILGGDNTTGKSTCEEFDVLLQDIARPMEERRVPWAHVFGNHDISPDVSKEYQQAGYESCPMCVSKSGPEELPGVGNYFLPVLDEKDEPVFGIWALDSHQDFETPSAPAFYDGDLYRDLLMPSRLMAGSDWEFIRFEQIMWYWNSSVELEKLCGSKLPSLMVFHIPLFEFNALLLNANRTGMKGEYNERVSASEINSGMFAAVLQRGDVKALFAGHDHNNTFDGTYVGIRMGFDGSAGYHAYGMKDSDPGGKHGLRGGRVFDIRREDPQHIDTHMVFIKDLQ